MDLDLDLLLEEERDLELTEDLDLNIRTPLIMSCVNVLKMILNLLESESESTPLALFSLFPFLFSTSLSSSSLEYIGFLSLLPPFLYLALMAAIENPPSSPESSPSSRKLPDSPLLAPFSLDYNRILITMIIHNFLIITLFLVYIFLIDILSSCSSFLIFSHLPSSGLLPT